MLSELIQLKVHYLQCIPGYTESQLRMRSDCQQAWLFGIAVRVQVWYHGFEAL